MLKKINKLSAKDQVLNAMRKAIFNGDLKSGKEITQTEMADMFGVSRMPVREAFQELFNEGLINIQKNRRVIIVGLTKEDISDHYEIRAMLEGMAAKKACLYPGHFEKIKSIHAKLLSADKYDYVDLNQDFHHSIWEAANSSRLNNLLHSLRNGIQLQFPDFVQFQVEKSVDEHKNILSAIISQNEEAAFENMKNHILRSKEDFLRNIQL